MSQSQSENFQRIQTRFKQQRLPACRPFLSPISVSIVHFLFAVISLIFNIILVSNESCYIEKEYNHLCDSADCTIYLDINHDIKGPIYFYYKLTNFYQNSFYYMQSIDYDQLTGNPLNQLNLQKCSPMIKSGDNYSTSTYVPCGVISLSVFNDTFSFQGLNINENNIAEPQFRELIKAPHQSYQHANNWLSTSLFPGGQTNEHFLNWIRISPFSTFLKLWGKIDEGTVLKEGRHKIEIKNNYPVSSFMGTKSIVIKKCRWFGGNNYFFKIFFLIVSICAFCSSVTFAILYFNDLLPLYKHLKDEQAFNPNLTQPL